MGMIFFLFRITDAAFANGKIKMQLGLVPKGSDDPHNIEALANAFLDSLEK